MARLTRNRTLPDGPYANEALELAHLAQQRYEIAVAGVDAMRAERDDALARAYYSGWPQTALVSVGDDLTRVKVMDILRRYDERRSA